MSELLNFLNNYPRVCALAEDTETGGLMTASHSEKRQERRIIKLTEKGEKPANYLSAYKVLKD